MINGEQVMFGSPVHSVFARVAELVDALVLGTSGVTRESSSLSFRTIFLYFYPFKLIT